VHLEGKIRGFLVVFELQMSLGVLSWNFPEQWPAVAQCSFLAFFPRQNPKGGIPTLSDPVHEITSCKFARHCAVAGTLKEGGGGGGRIRKRGLGPGSAA
jgi:hypothetical protein